MIRKKDNLATHEKQLYVKKLDSSYELFDQSKLMESLIHAGAQENQAEKIVKDVINAFLDEGKHNHEKTYGKMEAYCTASEIYTRAFNVLKQISRVSAARYSLRRSLLEFGPTGFPFEEYIAELFRALWGYEAVTDQVVLGACVPHEVDVVAWNSEENKLIMAEVKYHHDPASKTDLKVSLYVKARYDDLKENLYSYGNVTKKIDEGWLITNTRFTDTAITYAECNKVKLLSWDYPKTENLRTMIEKTRLHPVTCLTTLNQSEKRVLLEKDIVLVKNLFDNVKNMEALGFSKKKIETVLNEASEIIETIPQG